ncbi:MAG: Voltage-gated potassium channel Kch [Pelotomaculum sp. PtaU1.Bin035]|nr:MAG: Voltage-gated potassium channel Kch [Pelotomaculum sp. PtaU1.Bin035]
MTSIRPILYAALALLALMSAGIYSLIIFEDKSFMDALWLVVITITTVGFGDVVPSTTAGRIIIMLLIAGGAGLLTYVISTIFVGVLEGHLSDIWGKRRMLKKIDKLRNHIVLCGAGRVGGAVIAELIKDNQKFVVIEKDMSLLEDLRFQDSILFIAGDATEDRVLLSAQVPQAKGVITTLSDDAGNLMITMACKDFNPEVKVVVRANRPESIIRLKRAGADVVVSPSAIAGNRMALAALKPASVAFVQKLIEEKNINLEMEELTLNQNSKFAGKLLMDSRIKEEYGVMVLAIKRGNDYIVNPDSSEKLCPGDLLILCGPAERLTDLEKVATGK